LHSLRLQQFVVNYVGYVDMIDFIELNNDQRREKVNSDQRYEAFQQASATVKSFRGSLVWHSVGGTEHLMRSYYNSAGVRRQKVEGRRSPETEAIKVKWDAARQAAQEVLSARKSQMERQTAVNRALRLGRVPHLTARIIRAVDNAGLLGAGIRIVGTNAIFAYEAIAGVFVDPGITATDDIDLLMDARRSLKMVVDDDIKNNSLLGLLKKVDKSFERTRSSYRAANREGYLVDLIKPPAKPIWRESRESIGNGEDELVAAAIEGLDWLENSPPFEAIAIDEKGEPLRIVAPDPRIFAAHKFWISQRGDREPVKRQRDRAQAETVAQLTTTYFKHLPYEASELRALPRNVFENAAPLFIDT